MDFNKWGEMKEEVVWRENDRVGEKDDKSEEIGGGGGCGEKKGQKGLSTLQTLQYSNGSLNRGEREDSL